jgi:hypothetical protein
MAQQGVLGLGVCRICADCCQAHFCESCPAEEASKVSREHTDEGRCCCWHGAAPRAVVASYVVACAATEVERTLLHGVCFLLKAEWLRAEVRNDCQTVVQEVWAPVLDQLTELQEVLLHCAGLLLAELLWGQVVGAVLAVVPPIEHLKCDVCCAAICVFRAEGDPQG